LTMGCKKIIRWHKYPLREKGKPQSPGRYCGGFFSCRICGDAIDEGDWYFDGGWGVRAHASCARQEIKTRIDAAREAERREAAGAAAAPEPGREE